MKTLKKTLCLVLAVVMVVGVLILPAYAADDYDDAIEALQNYGVLQGYPDGKLHEDANITRGQMAAIIYRIMTGDTSSTDAQVADKFGSYADRYTDANVAPWAKGYIGFCTNAGVLKGYDTGAIQPNKQISGTEVMAMLLRALGYDHNNEYTGNNWQYNVLSDAAKAGISKNVTVDPAKATPRGAVAQYTFDAATKTDRVAPTVYPNVGYASIGKKLMDIGSQGTSQDKWGAPSTVYNLTYTWPDTPVVKAIEIADKALLESYVPVTEAAVYAAAKLNPTSAKEFPTYTNGKDNVDKEDVTTSTHMLGGQGRLTRVYKDRIVYVDTFLSEISSIVNEVKVNGQVAVPNSYDTTTYYGNGTTAYTTKLTNSNKTTTFAKGDMLASNAVTKAVDFADSGIKSLEGAVKANTATVTVNAIVKGTGDTATAAVNGLIGTNGTTYLYNCTYGYNGESSVKKLGEEDIGKTVTLYLDAHNNILGIEPAATASTKTGVVTDYNFYRIKANSYAAELTVLTSDNTTTTVRFLSAKNDPYDTDDEAEAAAANYMGELVTWDPDTDSNEYPGYSKLGIKNAFNEITDGKIEAGEAEALAATAIINDKTVFFIANYQMSNSKGGNVFTGYSIVTGFQNIMDMSLSGKIVTADSPTGELDKLKAAWIADKGVAKYVLVIGATDKSTNTVETVKNYAFLTDPTAFVKVYDNCYQYDAVINGTAHQPLRVNYTPGTGNEIEATGLYTYSEYTNDGWKNVTLTQNKIDAAKYDYQAGVLHTNDATTGGVEGDKYLTVAKNAVIYIVSPTTGTSVKVDATLDNVAKVYKTAPIWYQLDQYGWINVIYVAGEPSVSAGTAPAAGTLELDTANLSLTKSGTSGKTITVTGGTIKGTETWETAKCSVSAVVKIWNGIEFVKYTTGKYTNKDTSDKVTLSSGTNTFDNITTELPLGPGNYVVEITVTGVGKDSAKKTADTVTAVLYIETL